MKEVIRSTPSKLFKVSQEIFNELFKGDKEEIIIEIKNNLKDTSLEKDLFHSLSKTILHLDMLEHSWALAEGEKHPYIVLDLIEGIKDQLFVQELLLEVGLSQNPMIPYDFKALALEMLLSSYKVELFHQTNLEKISKINHFSLCLNRGEEKKIFLPTDGIDHLFPIPMELNAKLELMQKTVDVKVKENNFTLIRRFLSTIQLSDEIISEKIKIILDLGHGLEKDLVQQKIKANRCFEVNARIEADCQAQLINAEDYLVLWDQEVVSSETDSFDYTVAEILRIVLMSGEFKMPDLRVRRKLLEFYRSVLKISGRSIIGLSAGIFHVEHGTMAFPSFIYMGRDAALGKGCIIDGVGGAVILSSSFLGGGFMPILIHTHKHIKKKGSMAIYERKTILPCIFFTERGSRLPMSAIGLFETADYLDKNCPYEGIKALHLDGEKRAVNG